MRNHKKIAIPLIALMLCALTNAHSQGDSRLLDRAKVLWKGRKKPRYQIQCWHYWFSNHQVVVHDGSGGVPDVLIDLVANTMTPRSQWSAGIQQAAEKKADAYFNSSETKLMQVPTMDSYGMSKSSWPPRSLSYHGLQIALSADTHIRWVDLSPRKDKAVWLLTSVERNPIAVQLHRLYSKIKAVPKYITALWITRKGDPQPYELGWIERLAQWNGDDIFRDVQWAPDGKSITFMYRCTLYSVSAQ